MAFVRSNPVIKVRIIQTAMKRNLQSASIVAEGFLVGHSGVVTGEAVVKSIMERFHRVVGKPWRGKNLPGQLLFYCL